MGWSVRRFFEVSRLVKLLSRSVVRMTPDQEIEKSQQSDHMEMIDTRSRFGSRSCFQEAAVSELVHVVERRF